MNDEILNRPDAVRDEPIATPAEVASDATGGPVETESIPAEDPQASENRPEFPAEGGADSEVQSDGTEPVVLDVSEGSPSEILTARYEVVGLIDYTDEQGNIRGQLEIGSIQEFPLELGNKYCEQGLAKIVTE